MVHLPTLALEEEGIEGERHLGFHTQELPNGELERKGTMVVPEALAEEEWESHGWHPEPRQVYLRC